MLCSICACALLLHSNNPRACCRADPCVYFAKLTQSAYHFSVSHPSLSLAFRLPRWQVTFLFPILNGGLGTAGTFWLFFGVCVASFFWMLRYVPETRGKTLEEIERMLQEGRIR